MIASLASELKVNHKTNDPFVIASNLGIKIIYRSYSQALRGYLYNDGVNVYIVVNKNIDKLYYPVIVAHELGHYLLFHECHNHFMYSCQYEFEAQKFAAELLLDYNDNKHNRFFNKLDIKTQLRLLTLKMSKSSFEYMDMFYYNFIKLYTFINDFLSNIKYEFAIMEAV